MKPIRTALVGFGISGQCFQAPILSAVDKIDLVCVVSRHAQKVHEHLPDVDVYPTIDAMLAQSDVQLVVIATPNTEHAPMAHKALQAGKHVVVEKPFVIHSQEGAELITLANEKGLQLSVYQSRRFDGDFLTIKRLIAEDKLGPIHTFDSSYNRYRPEVKVRWREQAIPGAGILYDLGAHLIDQALQLFGLPQSVNAQLRNRRPNAQAVDHFRLMLSYPDKDVLLHGNCLSTTAGPRFQVHGEKGSYIKYGMDPQEDQLRAFIGPNSEGWGQEPEADWGTFVDAQEQATQLKTETGGYEAFYQQVAKAIHTGAPLPVTAQQALDVIRIIEAAYQSQHQQQRIALGALPQ